MKDMIQSCFKKCFHINALKSNASTSDAYFKMIHQMLKKFFNKCQEISQRHSTDGREGMNEHEWGCMNGEGSLRKLSKLKCRK